MIEASFDAGRARGASVSGAYQYDTGQRLRLHGLPTPKELLEMDELLSGETVTVQVQYSHKGDEQSEMRLARYDEEAGVWLADVPNAYLTRSAAVIVHVYVMYGVEDGLSRAKTCYEAAFTPVSRPAPSTMVTPEQVSSWDAMVEEVNLTLSEMNAAISEANASVEGARTAADGAQAAASGANAAAGSAQAAAQNASAMTGKLRNMRVTANTLSPGSSATAALSDDGTRFSLALGIPSGATGATGPQGERGPKGDKGDTGPAGVSFRLDGTTLYITTG
ncbi:MAG: collagen-like protein [Clostridia bacterium]|nr:collagen-like protein [Clostridia bacterium]